jgi:hypothetical protein
MNFMEVQRDLAAFIKSSSTTLKGSFWRLTGDEPNSLCRFLGITEEELRVILRLSKIYTGEQNNFSKNKFELLVTQCETDWTTYRIQGKVERFIMLGNADSDIVLPKDHYDSSGTLTFYPVEDEHLRRLRTSNWRIFPNGLYFP